MMKHRFFVFPVILCFALLLGACSSETETVKPGCLLLDGKNVAVPWVMKINGKEIGAEEYRYQFMTLKTQAEADEELTWNDENAADFKEQVAEYLALLIAVEDMAGQYGIGRGDESVAYAETQIESVKARYESEALFQSALTGEYMTEELFSSLLESDYIQIRLYETLFEEGGEYYLTDEELLDMVEQDYVRVRYLAVKFDEDNAEEKRAYTEELLQRIEGGEDFVEMVNEYGEESGMQGNPDGLYLTRGATNDAVFEEACFSLEVDEISGVVASENTYYIIKRLPIEETYVSENANEMLNSYYGQIFSEKLVTLAKGYDVQYSEIYDQITVHNMG